jgi:rRNA maturation protein Nop10
MPKKCEHQSTKPSSGGYTCTGCGEVFKAEKPKRLSTADQCGPGAYSNEYD